MQKEYTYEQAAQELNTSVFTIRKAVSYGNLHPIKHEGDKTKYISAEEIEHFRGKSLLTRRKSAAPAVPAPNTQPMTAGEAISNERLLIIIQFIQTLFGGLTSEAGKVSSQLINAALGSSRFNESIKELESFLALTEAKKGVTPLDIGEFIQRLDVATAKDLHTDKSLPNDIKVTGATFLAELAQREKILQPAAS